MKYRVNYISITGVTYREYIMRSITKTNAAIKTRFRDVSVYIRADIYDKNDEFIHSISRKEMGYYR